MLITRGLGISNYVEEEVAVYVPLYDPTIEARYINRKRITGKELKSNICCNVIDYTSRLSIIEISKPKIR